MSSDNHASYARIGFTVFIGLAAIVGTLIYLGGMRGRDGEIFVETYYDKPVSGLSVGSTVNFRGVKLGEVREISFVGNQYDAVNGTDHSRIYILMALQIKALTRSHEDIEFVRNNLEMFVKDRGLRATVTSSGITGLSRVELDFHPHDGVQDVPSISWTPRNVYIPQKTSLLDNFSVAATKVMNQINRMDLETVWSNISFSVESLARMTDGAKTMLEARKGDVERIADDLSTTTASLRELTEELKRNPSLLVRERIAPRLSETE